MQMKSAHQGTRRTHIWRVVGAGILIATCALIYSVAVGRRPAGVSALMGNNGFHIGASGGASVADSSSELNSRTPVPQLEGDAATLSESQSAPVDSIAIAVVDNDGHIPIPSAYIELEPQLAQQTTNADVDGVIRVARAQLPTEPIRGVVRAEGYANREMVIEPVHDTLRTVALMRTHTVRIKVRSVDNEIDAGKVRLCTWPEPENILSAQIRPGENNHSLDTNWGVTLELPPGGYWASVVYEGVDFGSQRFVVAGNEEVTIDLRPAKKVDVLFIGAQSGEAVSSVSCFPDHMGGLPVAAVANLAGIAQLTAPSRGRARWVAKKAGFVDKIFEIGGTREDNAITVQMQEAVILVGKAVGFEHSVTARVYGTEEAFGYAESFDGKVDGDGNISIPVRQGVGHWLFYVIDDAGRWSVQEVQLGAGVSGEYHVGVVTAEQPFTIPVRVQLPSDIREGAAAVFLNIRVLPEWPTASPAPGWDPHELLRRRMPCRLDRTDLIIGVPFGRVELTVWVDGVSGMPMEMKTARNQTAAEVVFGLSLRGRVLDAHGVPARFAIVGARNRASGFARSVKTGVDGTFWMAGLDDLQLEVVAFLEGKQAEPLSVRPSAANIELVLP